jgi:hypothetical protein
LWIGEQKLSGAQAASYHLPEPKSLTEAAWLVDWNGKVLRTVTTPSRNTSGMAVGGGYVWMVANAPPQGVFQVDMDSKLVSHRQIPLGPANDGGGSHGAHWQDGKLWIASLRLRGNLRVDPKTWEPEFMIPFYQAPDKVRYHDITWDDGTIWQVVGNDSKRYSEFRPSLVRYLGNYQPRPVRQIKVDTPEEAAQAVEKLVAAGVDVIKAYVGLTPAHYRAISDAAHRHGVRVHAHVYAEHDTRNALENGVDVLTHAGSAGTSPPYSAELIRDIVNAGRPVVVTAAHRSWVFPDTVAFPERLQDPRLREDFGPEIYAEVQSSFDNFQRLNYMGRVDREVFFRERGLGQFIESGAVLGMGTDSGTPLNFHTEALWREIKAHVDLGMPAQKAISAATRINARILGKGGELGTIEPGKLADIIVVRGNPLFDIQALADVEVVIKGGTIYKGGPAGTTTSRR